MRLKFFRGIAFLMIALSFCFVSASADILPVVGGTEDESAVLQKSLDLPQLQSYFPSNPDGSRQQVRILQHPVVFASNLSVAKFGLPVLFVDRQGTSELDAYVNFTSFSVSEKTATASFIITYGRNSAKPASVKVSVVLARSGAEWNIVESTLNP